MIRDYILKFHNKFYIMINKFIYTVLVLFFLACSPEKKINKAHIKNHTQKSINNINRNLLNGIWAENQEDNAIFAIQGDSLYFTEDIEHPCLIEVKSDTLITHLIDGYIVKDKIVKLSKDSLILYNYNFKDSTKLYNRGKY